MTMTNQEYLASAAAAQQGQPPPTAPPQPGASGGIPPGTPYDPSQGVPPGYILVPGPNGMVLVPKSAPAPVPEPTPTPTPIPSAGAYPVPPTTIEKTGQKPVGDIVAVSPTSGADRYIVKTLIDPSDPSKGYESSLMSRAEVESLGGQIPEADMPMWVREGSGYQGAPETLSLQVARREERDAVKNGTIVIPLADNTELTLSEFPLPVQQAFREAYAEGGLYEAYDALNPAIAEYNDYAQRVSESTQASQAKREREVLPELPESLQSLYKQGKKEGDLTEFTEEFNIYAGEVEAARETATQEWERNVLPYMPQEYQDAYAAGDMAEVKRLADKYQAEYETWIDANIKADDYLSGILANQGETSAIQAWQKRQSDLSGIQTRQERALLYLGSYKVQGENTYRIADYLNYMGNTEEAKTTLRQAGFTDEQITEASEATKSGKPTPEIKPGVFPGFFDKKAYEIQKWQMEFISHGGTSEAKSKPGQLFDTAMQGVGAAGVTLITSIPLLFFKGAADPKNIPSLAWDTVKGMGFQIGTTFQKAFTGAYFKEIGKGNLFPFMYDTIMTAAILYPIGKGAFRAAGKITTYLVPRGLPLSTIAKEVSTGRIKTPTEFGVKYAEAMAEALKKSATKGGEFTGEVAIKGTPFNLRYLKTPYEQVVGDVLFHGTKDEIGAAGNLIKESLLKVAEREGKINAGEGGIYTSPFGPIGYTRGGRNPGLMMIITDASKIKSGAKALSKGLTDSDKFIRQAEEGFYGPSKVWRGDLETEIVGAPGTEIITPKPNAGLATRVLAGKYSDFFTFDNGKFVPIKVGLDLVSFKPEVAAILKNPLTWYSIKLWTLRNALRDTAEAIKHPNMVLKDIIGITKETLNIKRLFREGTGGKGASPVMPGVRDIYLIHEWGKSISEIMRNLWDEAFKKTKKEIGEKSIKSDEFRKVLERNIEESYREQANSLIDSFSTVVKAYASSRNVRNKFESSYLATLGASTSAMVKYSSEMGSILSHALSDVTSVIPEDAARLTSRSYDILSSGLSEKPITTPISTLSEIETPPSTPPSETPPSTPPSETPPSTPPPETPPSTPPPGLSRMVATSPAGKLIPGGSIAWASGEIYAGSGKSRVKRPVWKYIPPPYDIDKPITLSAPPIGAINSGSINPRDTIQVIGVSRKGVPERVDVDLGWTDITIIRGREIDFSSGGETTNVGERIPEFTRGMSVQSANGGGEDITELQPRGINRVKMSKKKPRRKGKRISDYEYMTTLRGFRP